MYPDKQSEIAMKIFDAWLLALIVGLLLMGSRGIWMSNMTTDWKIAGIAFLVFGFPALAVLSHFPSSVDVGELVAMSGAFLLLILSMFLVWNWSNTVLMYLLVSAVVVIDFVGIAVSVFSKKRL